MNRRKFAIAVTLVCTMIMTSATAFAGATTRTFTDLKTTNWAYDAVSAMTDKGVLAGYPDGTFKPAGTLTYGEFIKMALIAATNEDPGNATSGNWAANYYNKALELKYFTTADIATSDLSKPIPRAKMALIISSILGDVKIDNADKIMAGITDVTSSAKYENDILKAYASGILTGYTDKTFKPDKTLTRAEAATVIYRFVEPSKRVLPDTSGTATDKGYTVVNLRDYVDPSTVKAALVRQGIPNAITGDFTDKAWLYNDASQFNMGIQHTFSDGRISAFNHTLSGFIYLVKDKEIIAYCATTPRYDSAGNFLNSFSSMLDMDSSVDVKTADYILVTHPEGSTALTMLIPNPFQ